MKTRQIAGLAATLLIALPVAGCGGSDKSNRKDAYKPPTGQSTTKAADANPAEAKSAARNAVSLVESCYVENQDYSKCTDDKILTDGSLDAGSGPGQVRVADATPATYTIEARSEAGGVFAVAKDESGAVKRTCTGAGCEGGTW
jgi:hypothetical protein